MAITASDILFKLSTTSGSSGHSTAQADPNASLGKYMSVTDITDATLNNLFDDVTGDENAANDVEYRCFFVANNHATLPLQSAKVWMSAEVADGADAAIGLDTTGPVATGDASAQAVEIANESTAPAGVSFSSPTSKATGLSIGDLGPGSGYAIWVRRTCSDSAAKDNDGVTISVGGDTAE